MNGIRRPGIVFLFGMVPTAFLIFLSLDKEFVIENADTAFRAAVYSMIILEILFLVGKEDLAPIIKLVNKIKHFIKPSLKQ